jgi:hypothetical protein
MIKGTLVKRALVVANVLVFASAGIVSAQDIGGPPSPADAAPAKPAEAKPFSPTIYFGPAIGVADQKDTEFGWALHSLVRPFRYGAFQLEYFNMGSNKGATNNGDYDGLYIGAMPILPLDKGFSLFGQVGGAFGNGDESVAGGGGALYELPTEIFNKVFNSGVTLRADYKYLKLDGEAAHLFTVGFMFGVHK